MATSLHRTDDRTEHERVVSVLFGLLTAKLEDGATLAVKGQEVGGGQQGKSELASSVTALLEEADILNQAISTILMLAAGSPGSDVE